eukprot:Gb_16776 [translate_table: standard]
MIGTKMILKRSSYRSAIFLLRGASASSSSYLRPSNGLHYTQHGNGPRPDLCCMRIGFDLHTASGGSTPKVNSYFKDIRGDNVEIYAGSGFFRGLSSASVSATFDGTPSAARAKGFAEIMQHYGQCYWELSKARLSMLVVATSGAGFVLGSSANVDWAGLCWTCAGTMMVAASANSFNQIFEVNKDAKMKRTMRRPLPAGRLSIPNAITWAMSMGAAGSALLLCKANVLAAGLAASNLALYALVYTPLKQIHPVNTWVGAVVGAIPPLLGWAAATGQVTLGGLVLPALLYFWQIPHFMALAYLCRHDYAAGGFKMLSLLDGNGERTSLAALRNCLYLLPVGFVAYDWGITSAWFGLETVLLTSGMGAAAVLFYLNRNTKSARRLFHASLLYLPLLMAGMLFHRLPYSQLESATTDLGEKENMTVASVVLSNSEESKERNKLRKHHLGGLRSPVAYASVAPFPFLPPPMFSSTD